jgi:hypothetical protein
MFGRKKRRDAQVAAALVIFQANPDREFYALDLAREGISQWHLYPALIMLQEKGIIRSRWADLEPKAKHRRRLYRLNTKEGTA